MGGGVRLRRSRSSLAPRLMLRHKLSEEMLSSSLKLKSLLSLPKLLSLSTDRLLPDSFCPSISTLIMGGGARLTGVGMAALAAGGVGACSEKMVRERDLCLLSGWCGLGVGDLEGEGSSSRFPCERLSAWACCSPEEGGSSLEGARLS